MKNGKKPTVRECEHIKSCRLNPFNWFVSKKGMDKWLLINRETGRTRTIPAP